MNSARWTWFAIGFMTAWAYIVAFLVYQLGMWFTEGTFGTAQVMACLLSIGILYMALRPNPHAIDDTL
jgi:ferrous iron transport protein B